MELNKDKQYANLTGDAWTSIGTTVVGGVFGAVNNKAQMDALRKQGEIQAKNNETQLELAKYGLATAQANAQAKAKEEGDSGSNTVLYVALGVGGVLVLGLVAFALTRK